MATHALSLVFATACLTAACAGAPTCPDVAPGGPGRLDTRFVSDASSRPGVYKLKLRLGADGGVEKLAVYHKDASVVPAPVTAVVQEKFPGLAAEFYETEIYADAGLVYEVEVKQADGKLCEVSATLAGALRYVECEIDPATLPEPVKAAVEKAAPAGRIAEAESKKGPGMDEFSLEVEREGRMHYLRVGVDGALLGHHWRIPAEVDVPFAAP